MEKSNGEIKSENGVPAKGKPPTRLQKRAPAALQIDANATAHPLVSSPSSSAGDYSGRAIPLLSPLVVSPSALPAPVAGEESPLPPGGDGNDAVGTNVEAGGWPHPATAGSAPPTEAGTLFSFFQSQCALAHHLQ